MEEEASKADQHDSNYSKSTQPDDKQPADKLTATARQKGPQSKSKQSGKKSVQIAFSKDTLSKVLQKHELPKKIITIPSFPRNRSMKIDRNAVVRIISVKE